MLDCCFFLDGPQHIAGPGDVREVDLGLDLVFGVDGTRGLGGTRSGFGVGLKALADQFRLVLFQRTGVRLLFRDADLGQNVKNGFALDLQLTGQIIDSNLHPSRFPFSGPPGSQNFPTRAYQPHGIGVLGLPPATTHANPACSIRKSFRIRHSSPALLVFRGLIGRRLVVCSGRDGRFGLGGYLFRRTLACR